MLFERYILLPTNYFHQSSTNSYSSRHRPQRTMAIYHTVRSYLMKSYGGRENGYKFKGEFKCRKKKYFLQSRTTRP